jgi:hypothetical protein
MWRGQLQPTITRGRLQCFVAMLGMSHDPAGAEDMGSRSARALSGASSTGLVPIRLVVNYGVESDGRLQTTTLPASESASFCL